MMNLSAPQSTGSNYLKLEPGENKLRIMGQIIDGWEAWADNPEGGRKVFREKDAWKALELVKMGVLDKQQKQFYAAIVWNYRTEQFECMVQTQKSIKEGIYLTYSDEDWGNPNDYDIVISKTGSGMETKYTVIPKPKKPYEGENYYPNSYCIENLYGCGDPFEVKEVEAESSAVKGMGSIDTFDTSQPNTDHIPF